MEKNGKEWNGRGGGEASLTLLPRLFNAEQGDFPDKTGARRV
jgi:hypothetical protein